MAYSSGVWWLAQRAPWCKRQFSHLTGLGDGDCTVLETSGLPKDSNKTLGVNEATQHVTCDVSISSAATRWSVVARMRSLSAQITEKSVVRNHLGGVIKETKSAAWSAGYNA